MNDKNGWWDTEDDIDEFFCIHGIDVEEEITKLLVDEINNEKTDKILQENHSGEELHDEIMEEEVQEVKEAQDEDNFENFYSEVLEEMGDKILQGQVEENDKYGIGIIDREKDELVQAMMLDNLPTVLDIMILVKKAGKKVSVVRLMGMELTTFNIKDGGDV